MLSEKPKKNGVGAEIPSGDGIMTASINPVMESASPDGEESCIDRRAVLWLRYRTVHSSFFNWLRAWGTPTELVEEGVFFGVTQTTSW